ncbi:MAG: GTPase HflX [Desulfobacterales bacterium]
MLTDPIELPKAILVSVCLSKDNYEAKQYSLDELERLADTAGIETVNKIIQRRAKIDSSQYLGTGLLNDIKEEMDESGAELLVFDNSLSPNQARNLQKSYDIDAIDRTEVILQVFHDHARTPESRMQVRLAELQYQLPRLKALWSHLDRQRGSARSAGSGGGGDAQRGTGEKQIEIDRRLIEKEIRSIKKKLAKVDIQMEITGKKRLNRKKVCLVGYTNAGKSTLFNRLTDAKVLVEDKLFATLDSTARSLSLGKGKDIILSDTVGFISDLPHHLVASFRATLREVVDADLLLFVVDISDPVWGHHIEAVQGVLRTIGADGISQLFVFNKTDRLSSQEQHNDIKAMNLENTIEVSAKKGTHIDQLVRRIDDTLNDSRTVEMLIPFSESKTIDWLHRFSEIRSKEYTDEGTLVCAVINAEDMAAVKKFELV